ncbi:NAD(P)-binding protein [Amylocystis lapponica]|nr:NAD(P)-binding protein [Amylocystis lapponica]
MSSPRVWLITGISSGLGRALAEYVLSQGEILVGTVRKPEVVSDLTAQYDTGKLLVVTVDVTKREQVVDAFSAAQKAFGRIDVVYNNAGVCILSEIEGTPEDKARYIFDVNFFGAASVTMEAVRVFREVNMPQGGRLLQASSAAGIVAFPGVGYYAATMSHRTYLAFRKSALEALSEALAMELDPAWNVKITLLEMTIFLTKIQYENAIVIPKHPAYHEGTVTAGMRPAQEERIIGAGIAVGNLSKFCEHVYAVSSDADPPLRLPLGQAAIVRTQNKILSGQETLEKAKPYQVDIDNL